jgi:hypothetical protein
MTTIPEASIVVVLALFGISAKGTILPSTMVRSIFSPLSLFLGSKSNPLIIFIALGFFFLGVIFYHLREQFVHALL